jgi:TP901 family phage tail tape measure protein
MADFEAKFGVNIDTTAALASIKQLQSQISTFHRQLAKGSAVNTASQQNLQRNLISDINSSGKFNASMQRVHSTTENFTNALEKNKLSMGQYFRYAGGASKTFGRKFISEFNTINKVARERVKTLQTQYIAMGRDANGALQSIAVRPLSLDMNNLATKTAIAAQKQQIFNQLLRQGSTNLLNFGKNTQWAGRQLMVGFTIPLAIFGSMAGKTFMKVEEEAIRFRRVYGELFTPPEEANAMIDQLKELASEFTQYGVSLESTLALASDVAAMGKTGADLMAQVSEATRLSVLGSVDQAKALEATISVTNAFGISAEDLAGKIDFLNAVENQTVTAIEDLTIAIPKAGPVIQQLGGSVEDLAYFLTAMKEGGINASEGANALKSGLARIINPTMKASEMMKGLGININGIVEGNAGDIKTTVTELAFALDELQPLQRSRAIEELFGKFQFARISTLFQNITKEGSQAARVLDLTRASTQELANLSSKELGAVSESTTFAFKKAFEDLRIAIAPIGEQFIKAATPIIQFATKLLSQFDKMGDGAKNFVVILTAVLGLIAPVALMTFGLLANGAANILKGFAALRTMFLRTAQDTSVLGSQTQYLTQEQLIANAASASLEQSHMRLTQQFTSETTAVSLLTAAYEKAALAASRLTAVRPMPTSIGKGAVKGYASGGIISGEGTGTSDSILAQVSNGEAIIPAKVVSKNPGFFAKLISGGIPGFAKGGILGGKVNVGGKEYGVPDGRSSGAMQSRIQGLADAGTSLDSLTSVMDKLEAQSKLTAAALKAEVRARGLSPKGGPSEVQRAHLTLPTKNADGSMGLSGLTREMSREQNIALRTGQNKDQFLKEYSSRKGGLTAAGEAGMRQTGALGPRESMSSDMVATMQQLDDEIGKLAHELSVDGLVSDAELAKAADIVIRKAESKSGNTGTAGSALRERQKAQVATRSAISSKMNAENIRSGKTSLRGNGVTLVDSNGAVQGKLHKADADRAHAARSAQEKREITAASRVSSSTTALAGQRSYTGYKQMSSPANSQSALIKKGAEDTKAYNKGVQSNKSQDQYMQNRDRKSPHRLAAKDGSDDAKAYNQGVKSGSRRSSSAGQQRQSGIIDAASQKPAGKRRSSTPQQNTSGDAARAAVAQRQSVIATQAQSAATKNSTARLQKMSGALSGGMFALTSLAGAGMMAGGKLGEVSQKVFQLSGVFFALIQITQMLTKESFLLSVANRKRAASEAAATVAAAGGGGLKKGLAGISAFVGGPMKMAFVAAGLAVAGLIAVFLHFKKKSDEAAKRVENLGKASNFSAEKLQALGTLFGKDINTSSPGSLGGRTNGKNADQKKQIDELSKSEELKAQFGDEIAGLESASNAQAKSIMRSLAFALASGGVDEESAGIILQSIAIAAEKGNLGLDFSKIPVTIPDLTKDRLEVSESANSAFDSALVRNTPNPTDVQKARQVFEEFGQQLTQDVISTASDLGSLRTEFENSAMSSLDFSTSVTKLLRPLTSLEEEMQKLLLPNLAEQLNLDPEAFVNVENLAGALSVLKAVAMGIDIDASFLETFNKRPKNSEDKKEQALAQRELNKIIEKNIELTIKGRKATEDKIITDQAAADLADLEAEVIAAKEKKAAFEALVLAGKDQTEALEMVSNGNMLVALTSAIAADEVNRLNNNMGDTTAVEDVMALFAELAAQELPSFDRTSGSGDKSPYQLAIESLKEERAQIKNNLKAYGLLRKAGMDISAASDAASDSTLALALATTKVGSKKYKEILSLVKEIDVVSKKNALRELLGGRSEQIQMQSQFLKIVPILSKMGVEAQDIVDILGNADLAKAFIADLKDGKLDAAALKNYLKQIEMMKSLEIQVTLTTPEGQAAAVSEAFSNISEWFATKKAAIDIQFRPRFDAAGKIIKEAEEAIESYTDKVSENEYQLSGIERSEDAINEKYEARIKSLEAIQNVNKLIQSQEKASLNVADALSRGDIAAAAQAVQEARSQAASDQADTMKANIDTAKERELASITSTSGQTRVELEKQIAGWKQEIERIEHDTLVPAQRSLNIAEKARDAQFDTLTYLGRTETQWGDIENATNLARVEAESYMDAIKKALALLPGLTGGKVDLGMGPVDKGNSNDSETAELNRLIQITRDRVRSGNFEDAAMGKRLESINIERIKKVRGLTGDQNTMGGRGYAMGGVVRGYSMGGLVPKYFASGGFAMGSDTVPAMLTPGEFVMRKSAVKSFGVDKMKSMNNGTSSADSVYNYSLNVNVKSDANPDQIASAVMQKIKSIDSQRIRGGRS